MIIISNFRAEYEQEEKAYRILSLETLYCPSCGWGLSGYDTRRRHVVDAAGDTYWLLLQRMRCTNCGKLHLVAPAFIAPKKHYEAAVIEKAKAGLIDSCPADDSTIRRWRR